MVRFLILALVLAAGCSSVRVLQPEAPPPRAAAAGPASLPPEPARPGRSGERAVTEEAATELYLDHEIARRRQVAAVEPPPRVVERPVADDWSRAYEAEYRNYRSRFPWSTAAGAGLGAIIGHQSGHRGEGAAIGAGLGLLFDLGRWF
jgi:hypothetical protein